MLEDLPFDIVSLHNAYAGGLDAASVVSESFRRIEFINDPGIFLHLIDAQIARQEAVALGSFDPVSMPLWGIPFAIKDNIDAAGASTTAGCPEFSYEAEQDAFVVALLRQAGAILIGKTNLDQFATGLAGLRTPYDMPKNAIDPEIVPGGSSSGSSVAVSHGIVTFALGTDTAGSGRVPAALNNVVGLKPSLGAISSAGVVPACKTLDTVSVFALTVEDAYGVYKVAAKFDGADSYARPITAPSLGSALPSFRVGVPDVGSRIFYGDAIQSDSFDTSLRQLSDLGGEIFEIDFSAFYEVANMLYEGPWVAERYTVIEDLLAANPEAVHPVTRRLISAAEQYSAADTFRAYYKLQALKRQTDSILEQFDLLCVPTIPTFYSVAELEDDPFGPNSRLGAYTNFVNLLDLCAIAAPVGARKDGRPGSVTLIAQRGQDALIAAVARDIQIQCATPLGATNWPVPQIEGTLEDKLARPDEIEIAVVGAHMSGLPLNHELTQREGRFLFTTTTAPTYRLFSLPGGAPARPGLIYDATGAAIAVEVWALPTSQVGAFLKNIPRPLGVGTLILDDGREVKGFLCEQQGADGAEDVTRFGGWRAFLRHQTSMSQTTQHQPKEPTDA